MKLKNIIKKPNQETEIKITNHFWVWIQENYWDREQDRKDNPFIIELHTNLNCYGDTLVQQLDIHLTGNETKKQIIKMVKDVIRAKQGETKTIDSVYTDMNYIDYVMDRNVVKKAIRKLNRLGLGNKFLVNVGSYELQGLIEGVGC